MKKVKIKQAFGVVMAQLREKNSLTQGQLSKLSKISRSHLSDIERGKAYPTLITIYQLSKSFKIYPNKFLSLVDRILDKDKDRD